MNKKQSTPEEVSQAIRDDFRKTGITLAEAARRIGKSTQNLSNILRGERRLSQSTAELLFREFGYSIPYLRFGEGTLHDNGRDDVPAWKDKELGVVYNLGYVFPNNSKLLGSKREQKLNQIASAFKEAFTKLYTHVDINKSFDMNIALDRPYKSIAKTINEKTLEASLLLYTGMLLQFCDIDDILGYIEKI